MDPPQQYPEIKCKQIFINNEWVNSESGKTFATVNPANGAKIADIQEGGKADIDKAVAAAQEAFKRGSPWRRMDASKRGLLLNKLADLLERDRCYIANLESLDVGKVYKNAYNIDTDLATKMLRYYAGWADKITGQTIPVDGDYFCYTRVEPVGVVGAIIPWNFPLMLMMTKIAPALACGCTVVVKPAEQTPLSALYTAQLIKEVGFPPGVVNVVPGFGHTAGAALVENMDVNKISFTGSTEVGHLIMKKSGESNLKRVTLELGGKSPVIIFPDANLDEAVPMAGMAAFASSGQICCAGTRTYVHEDIYDEFIQKATEFALKMKGCVGDPLDDKTDLGPQVDGTQLDKIMGLIESGKEQGARLMCGGNRLGDKGFYMEPTLFADVTEDMRIGREEIFGMVQSIFKFKTIDEAIEKANNTTYGLAASVFTKNLDTAMMIANSVQAGIVWINTVLNNLRQAPFGGFKQSGIGREMGEEGLRPYCEIKTVVAKIPQKNS